jgi:hypothetical protein
MYAGYFSEGASPAPGQPRRLSEGDLALLAFIRERTAAGVTHDQIAAQIAAGDLEGFTWSAPTAGQEEEEAQPKRQAGEAQPAALAIMAQTITAELAAARQREQTLWERIVEAEKRASAAEAALAAVKAAQARPWYRRLLGG